jgi:hypothetical protein
MRGLSRNGTPAKSDMTKNVSLLSKVTLWVRKAEREAYSIPSFFSLYRRARKVIPNAEAARVLL